MQEEYVSVDGHKIRYLREGTSKKILVLIHGLGASAERWELVLPYFSKHFTVIVPDLIGFGQSDKPYADYTVEFFANFLRSFFQELKIQKASIIGSSLGGQIAIEFVANNRDFVDKLILVSPAGAMKESTPALDAYIMAALYPDETSAQNAFTMMTGADRNVSPEIVESFVQRMRMPNAKYAFMSTLLGLKNAPEITSYLQIITTRTLVIWGRKDPVIPVKYAEQFVKQIKDCRFYQMEKCGHTPYVEDPSGFVKVALEFLRK